MQTVLVTGANRGLGFEVCKQLAQRGWNVFLTARDLVQAERAMSELEGEGRFEALQLDVTSEPSIEALAGELRERAVGPLDALINNAGLTMRGFDAEVARRTLDANYRGPARVTDALMPLLASDARIVMVSSGMGDLSHFGAQVHERLTLATVDRTHIEALAQEFVESVRRGQHEGAGFPTNAYSVSKGLLNAFTRVLSRELAGTGRRVNAICPGWVRTRMGGEGAPRAVSEGAAGIVWAATLDAEGPSGGFFRDAQPIAW